MQGLIQELLEEEVTELLGRGKSERRAAVDASAGYRNGYGEPRRLTLDSGTVPGRSCPAREAQVAGGAGGVEATSLRRPGGGVSVGGRDVREGGAGGP